MYVTQMCYAVYAVHAVYETIALDVLQWCHHPQNVSLGIKHIRNTKQSETCSLPLVEPCSCRVESGVRMLIKWIILMIDEIHTIVGAGGTGNKC